MIDVIIYLWIRLALFLFIGSIIYIAKYVFRILAKFYSEKIPETLNENDHKLAWLSITYFFTYLISLFL